MIQKSNNLIQLSDSTYGFVFHGFDDLGNAGILLTDEGVVVIDTDVRTVDELFATLTELTDKPVKFLINTHHAFDHSSANCIFADKGATIIGSKSCREEMIRHGENNMKRWSNRKSDIRKILEEKAIRVTLPHITFTRELHLNIGGKTINLFYYGHAHTPGDIVVYLPQEEILFAGDLLWFNFFPNVREANISNQITVINKLLEFEVKYFVPGHGPISADRSAAIKMRDYLTDLYKGIQQIIKDGKDIEEARKLEHKIALKYPDWRGRQFLTRAIDDIYQPHRD